jgi:hypothetical protein
MSTETLAQVINHPAFQKRLDLEKQIAALREELADAEQLARDLDTGDKDWSHWFDVGFYGAQELAALEAHLFAGDLRKRLRALEAQAGGAE